MGALWSDETVEKPSPYLSVYSLGSSSSCKEIEEQIQTLQGRKKKIGGLQERCSALQKSSAEVTSDGAEAIDDSGLACQHSKLVQLGEDLSVEILRLKQLGIDAEARAIVSGELDNDAGQPKKGNARQSSGSG